MKGYRALLQQCSLLSIEPMVKIKRQKQFYNQLIDNIQKVKQTALSNMQNLKVCLATIQEKSIKFLQQINWQVDEFLANFQNKAYEYNCGCGFSTNISNQYLNHTLTKHRIWKSPSESSHFVSFFGNVIPKDAEKSLILQKRFCHLEAEEPITAVKVVQNKTKQRNTKKESNQIKQTANKKKTKTQKEVEQKSKQRRQSQHFCGQCRKSIQNPRFYAIHFKTHDFIVHPQSSHIIIRKKQRGADLIPIKNYENSSQRFECPCNPKNSLEHKQFVAHVLKWHGGITPRVI